MIILVASKSCGFPLNHFNFLDILNNVRSLHYTSILNDRSNSTLDLINS